MTWVITTDTNTCRIYYYKKKPTQLTLLKEIKHPESKLKNSDLVSDKQGHYKANDAAHGNYSPHMEAKEIEIDNFSRVIANELDQGRNKQSYEKLIIIAPPQMSGLLFQHINKHVKELVTNNIQKDLLHLADHELLEFLQSHAQYPEKF